jgi:type II secretory pathway pseudopilin PulG
MDQAVPLSAGQLVRAGAREEGYTLIEALVAIVASIALIAGILSLTISAAQQQTHTANRVDKLLEAETGVGAIGRLVRLAHSVSYLSGTNQSGISLSGGSLSAATTIDCSSGACIVSSSGSANARPLSNLASTNVFTLYCRVASGNATSSDLTTSGCPSYSYVGLKAVTTIQCNQTEAATSACGNTVELDDGFNLLN